MSRIYTSHSALQGKLHEIKGFHSTRNAQVYTGDGSVYLFSYGTLIARITGDKIDFTVYHNYSRTTVQHLMKFMNQYYHSVFYIKERNQVVIENGYLGVDIPL